MSTALKVRGDRRLPAAIWSQHASASLRLIMIDNQRLPLPLPDVLRLRTLSRPNDGVADE
jgi:hypothetical protein